MDPSDPLSGNSWRREDGQAGLHVQLSVERLALDAAGLIEQETFVHAPARERKTGTLQRPGRLDAGASKPLRSHAGAWER
ncbi:MAG: hypothetical protein C4576_17450 [Desulfobacteraceae bacterium]|nr:MAG: hypothetical protein C4576_17450 [Desulfobacteraceae bacterium]